MLEQVEAVHVETGQVYAASAIAEDSPLKKGPWVCVAAGCRVPLHHRRGGLRVSPSGGDPVAYGATFVVGRSQDHNRGVSHPMPRQTRPTDGRDDGRRRHTHRLTDLPTPPADAEAQRGDGSGEPINRTQYQYGEPVHGLAGLQRFARAVEVAPELALSEQFRFAGASYFWNALYYPPTPEGLRKITRVSQDAFTKRGTAFYLEAVAAYRVYPTSDGKQLRLKLCSALPANEPTVQVLMPNTDEFVAATSDFRQGHRLAVFSFEIWKPKNGDAGLVIERPDQLLRY